MDHVPSCMTSSPYWRIVVNYNIEDKNCQVSSSLEPIMGITEYAPFGDLLGYLRKSRGLRDSYYNDPDIKPRSSLRSKQLLGFSRDIASGMEFLSLKKVLAISKYHAY